MEPHSPTCLAPELPAQAQERHAKIQVETMVTVILNLPAYWPGEWVC